MKSYTGVRWSVSVFVVASAFLLFAQVYAAGLFNVDVEREGYNGALEDAEVEIRCVNDGIPGSWRGIGATDDEGRVTINNNTLASRLSSSSSGCGDGDTVDLQVYADGYVTQVATSTFTISGTLSSWANANYDYEFSNDGGNPIQFSHKIELLNQYLGSINESSWVEVDNDDEVCLDDSDGLFYCAISELGGGPYTVDASAYGHFASSTTMVGRDNADDAQVSIQVVLEEGILGCMDSDAENYDPTADFDDGSCWYPTYGCWDPDANNYEPWTDYEEPGMCTYDEAPTVVTGGYEDLTYTSVTLGMSWTDVGSSNIHTFGIELASAEYYEDTEGWFQFDEIATDQDYGSPSSAGFGFSGLTCGTDYYYRAYADNADGRGYGEPETFTTVACVAPTVTTGEASNVTESQAELGFTVSDIGSANVYEYGIQFATEAHYLDNESNYNGVVRHEEEDVTPAIGGIFNLYELSCGTTYHYRAYAINFHEAAGYGDDETFTTDDCPPEPDPYEEGLVSYWPLDEATGQTRMDAFGNNDLSDNGTVVGLGDGHLEGFARFETGKYLSHADNAELSTGDATDFSFSFWVQMNAFSGTEVLISKFENVNTGEYAIFYEAGEFRFATYVDGAIPYVAAGSDITSGRWYHIGAIYDASEGALTLAVDGEANTITGVAAHDDTTAAFLIGAFGPGAIYPGNADIDEVRFWKRALSISEMEHFYGSEITVIDDGEDDEDEDTTGTVLVSAATGDPETGFWGDGSVPLEGWTVYVDETDASGVLDEDGEYEFELNPGTYDICIEVEDGYGISWIGGEEEGEYVTGPDSPDCYDIVVTASTTVDFYFSAYLLSDYEEEEDDEEEPVRRSSSSGGKPRAATPSPAPASGASTDTGALMTQLRALIAQFVALGGTVTPELQALLGTPSMPGTVRDLELGMEGEDVRALQTLLMAEGYSIPAGATGYFGSQTQSALVAYQSAHGIIPAIGYFGSTTRAQMKGAGLTNLWW